MNVDLVKQADHTLLVDLQLQVFSTGYIVSNAAGRSRQGLGLNTLGAHAIVTSV
jgi:hypothetical protein